MTDYENLPTPPRATADFCLIPIGTATPSVSAQVAAVQRLMAASGLSYTMHSAGTTVEGSWDEVFRLIGQAHTLVHQGGVLRVQTEIRAGSRTDKVQHFTDKVAKVESLLAADPAVPAAKAEEKEKTEAAGAQEATSVAPKKEAAKGTWASMFK